VQVWDASTGAELQKLNGHTHEVNSVASSNDNSMQVWNASTGAELQQFKHPDWVNSVEFSHDGIQIVSGENGNSVRVWDALTGAELQQLNGHSNNANSVEFSHNGIYIVSGSSDKSVRLWDAASTDRELQHLNSNIVSGSDVSSRQECLMMFFGLLQ
jgi:WD40 repeat protein